MPGLAGTLSARVSGFTVGELTVKPKLTFLLKPSCCNSAELHEFEFCNRMADADPKDAARLDARWKVTSVL
jgi:hypothetical protein